MWSTETNSPGALSWLANAHVEEACGCFWKDWHWQARQSGALHQARDLDSLNCPLQAQS